MNAAAPPAADPGEHNRRFYDGLWGASHLIEPQRFNTWPLVAELVAASQTRLEVAPGLRPRLPLERTAFVDISIAAARQLRAHGADATVGLLTALPYADASFDVVCAFDIVEHVADDTTAFAELARVSRPGAVLLLSVPLHSSAWTAFDAFVGHCRRYERADLDRHLARNGFVVEQSAVHGMQPTSSWLLDLGLWFLVHQRERAMWWYNRVFMPLGLRFQSALRPQSGWINDAGVDTVLLVCRRC